MPPLEQTLLEILFHLGKKQPHFADQFQRIGISLQGKHDTPEALERTVLDMVCHLLTKHPEFSSEFELLAAATQGKGEGAESVALEVKLMQDMLMRQPYLAVDVGGNIGDYTAAMRQAHPELEIHVFEPAKVNVDRLRLRFAHDRLITLIPMALSASAGASTLYADSPGSPLGSLTQRKLDCLGIRFGASESVETMRFEDYWAQRLQRRPIDMVKIDVEGHEMDVLSGFGEALAHTRVMQFEFGGANIDTRTYFRDFWYYFDKQGFSLYRISPHGAVFISRYQESDEYFTTTNYIAVNKRVLS